MIIQSKKVWIADQFIPAQIEMDGGKIVGIFPHGTKTPDTGKPDPLGTAPDGSAFCPTRYPLRPAKPCRRWASASR